RFEVVRVPAGHDDHVGGRRQLDAMEPRAQVVDFDRLGAGEALRVGELLPIVDDMEAEAGAGGDAPEVPADVAGADHIEGRRGGDRIDVDLHLPATDEPGFLDE